MADRYPLVLNGTTIQELQTGDAVIGVTVTGTELTVNKDTSGGYVGKTAEDINIYNTARTFLNKISAGATTAARTWLFPDKSGTVALLDDLFKPGSVIYFAGSAAPTGYLKANGAAISRTTYSDLFTAIGTTFGVGDGSTTFTLPDLRGEFLRGLDDSRGIDSGRSLGTAQSDAYQGHYHSINMSNIGNADVFQLVSSGGPQGGVTVGNAEIGATLSVTASRSDGTNGTPRVASETRPRNIALLICIKY